MGCNPIGALKKSFFPITSAQLSFTCCFRVVVYCMFKLEFLLRCVIKWIFSFKFHAGVD